MTVTGIIPARYGSTRFPGKPLVNILGKSMIQRVYEQCSKCQELNSVIVATDDNRILNHVLEFGGKAVMTSKKHQTGTERCNEILNKLSLNTDILINIQGDEPLINPLQITELINLFNNRNIEIATLARKIDDRKILYHKHRPKVIIDKNKYALNFSREITSLESEKKYYEHIGIYGYKKETLTKISQLPESRNEKEVNLEQLRWLDYNYNIKVGITNFQSFSVDTPEDVEEIKRQMR